MRTSQGVKRPNIAGPMEDATIRLRIAHQRQTDTKTMQRLISERMDRISFALPCESLSESSS